MTLMAGYDEIIEFAPSFISKLIRSTVEIGAGSGVFLNPPFAYRIDVREGSSYFLRLSFLFLEEITTELSRTESTSAFLRIQFPFEDTSVQGSVRGNPLREGGFSGLVEISGPIAITNAPPLRPASPPSRPVPPPPLPPPGSSNQAAMFDFSSANITVTFDEVSQKRLKGILGSIPLDSFAADVTTTVELNLRDRLNFRFPRIPPGQILQISPTLIVFGRTAGLQPDPGAFQILEMELATILGDDDRGVALGLFATFLSSTNGDFKQRTSAEGTVIQTGQDVALSVSENGFREAFFCHELPGRLGFPVITPPPMPPICGTAGPLRIPGQPGGLSRIGIDFLPPNLIRVFGNVTDSGFCFEVNGSFFLDVELRPAGTGTAVLATRLGEPVVDIDLSLDFFCLIVPAFLQLWVELAAITIVDAIVTDIIRDDFLSGLSAISPTGTPIPGSIPFLTLTQLDVRPTELTANATFDPPIVTTTRRLTVRSEIVETIVEEVPGETIVRTWPPECAGEYETTRILQTQRVQIEVQSKNLIGEPLRWFVGSQELTEPSGKVINRVRSFVDGRIVAIDTEIQYIVGEDFIEIRNNPEHGDYSTLVEVKGTETVIGSGPSASVLVSFQGGRIETAADQCFEDWARRRRRHAEPGPGGYDPFPGDFPPDDFGEWLKQIENGITPEVLARLLWPVILKGDVRLQEFLITLYPTLGDQLIDSLQLIRQERLNLLGNLPTTPPRIDT